MGALVSIVIVNVPEGWLVAREVKPFVIAAVVAKVWTPLASAEVTKLQLPLLSAVVVPSSVAPSKTLTVELTSAVPVNVNI